MSVWQFTVHGEEGSNELAFVNVFHNSFAKHFLATDSDPVDLCCTSGKNCKGDDVQLWWCVAGEWLRWTDGICRHTGFIYFVSTSIVLPTYISSYLQFSTCKITISNCEEACDRVSFWTNQDLLYFTTITQRWAVPYQHCAVVFHCVLQYEGVPTNFFFPQTDST